MNRPSPLIPQFDNFPPVLTALPHWVLWSYVLKDSKWTKVPKQPNRTCASTSQPSTWSTFDRARAAYEQGGFDGVGIVLSGRPIDGGLYLIGLDFDDCLINGELSAGASKAIEFLDSYCEISPSGEGIRLFVLHDKLVPGRKDNQADGNSREVYSSGRYLTVTGHILGEPKEVRHVA